MRFYRSEGHPLLFNINDGGFLFVVLNTKGACVVGRFLVLATWAGQCDELKAFGVGLTPFLHTSDLDFSWAGHAFLVQ